MNLDQLFIRIDGHGVEFIDTTPLKARLSELGLDLSAQVIPIMEFNQLQQRVQDILKTNGESLLNDNGVDLKVIKEVIQTIIKETNRFGKE